MTALVNFLRGVLPGLEDPWFPTQEAKTVDVDTVETPDGRVFVRQQPVEEYVNFNTGAVELRPAGSVSGPILVE